MTNEQAIETLESLKEQHEWDPAVIDDDDVMALNMAITEMMAKRPHGKWIFEEHGYLICSNCGYDCSHDEEGSYIRGSYCYNCGADMRGEDNGS